MSVPARLALIIGFLVWTVRSDVDVSRRLWRRGQVPSEGFFDPRNNHGNMLTFGFPTTPAGLGEPLNVIISASSDSAVLQDQTTNGGLQNYFLSLQFAPECLGQHLGDHQAADLGDGHGGLNETAVRRYDFGDSALGTCKESVNGGNHFRYWVQNGPEANSGAVFMAVSYEEPALQNHNIIFDGYNLGRDWLVGNITGSSIPTSELTNGTTYSGTTQFGGFTYETGINYMSGLLQNTSNGINHFLTVGGGPSNETAIDGLVAVLTVSIKTAPSNTNKSSAAGRALIPWWSSTTIGLSTLLVIHFVFGFGPGQF